MRQLILASVRSRVVSFAGTFLAVALAATIIAGAGLVIQARSGAHVTVPTRLAAPTLLRPAAVRRALVGCAGRHGDRPEHERPGALAGRPLDRRHAPAHPTPRAAAAAG